MTAAPFPSATLRSEAETSPTTSVVERAARLVLPIIPLLLMRNLIAPVTDPDAFWHVLAGRHLAETWSFSGPDPLATFTTNPWVLHEWLPQLLFAWAYSWAGLAGIQGLAFVAGLAIFFAAYRTARLETRVLPALVVAASAMAAMGGSLTPRPQLVTFLLTVVVSGVWFRTSRDLRPRWWLVPLTWVWATCHGMWFVGPAIGIGVVIGMALDRRASPRTLLRLGLIPLSSIVAAALTPIGPHLLLAPLTVSRYTQFVLEWKRPTLTEPHVILVLVLAAAVVMAWLTRRLRFSWTALGLVVFAIFWSFMYLRTIAVGGAVIVPVAAQALDALVHRREPEQGSARETKVLMAGLVLAVAVACVMLPKAVTRPGVMPSGLDARLATLPERTVVFNDYDIGGWFLLSHPGLRPVIDPRTELYAVDYVETYMRAVASLPGWERFVATSGASAALLKERVPLVEKLRARGWQPLGTSQGYVLLRAPR